MPAIARKTDRKGRVTLFSDFADRLVLIERVGDEEIRIRKAKAVPRTISLNDLLTKITSKNVHRAVEFGRAAGKEEL